MSRTLRRAIVILPLLLFVGVRAQQAAAAPVAAPVDDEKQVVIVDSSGVLPRWLHFNASAGAGWISAPAKIRKRYEGGWNLDGGVEARVHPRLRLRLNGEYQMLPSIGKEIYGIDNYLDANGVFHSDTLAFEYLNRGWLGAARLEAQAKVLPHFWIIGGIGRGYLGSGGRAYDFATPFESLNVKFEGSNGWAWIPMAGARYDFDVFGPLIAFETRYSALQRKQDVLHTWSIRVGGYWK
jgi:hypothetical protein